MAIGMNAGVDMGMLPPGSVDGFVQGLLDDVKNGKVSKRRIDEATARARQGRILVAYTRVSLKAGRSTTVSLSF